MNTLIITLLLLVILGLAIQIFFWRKYFNRLIAIALAISEGRRPTSFIRDGPEVFVRLSNLMEGSCERLDSLSRQVTREEFNLRAILSSMIEGVMVVDERMTIRLVNEAFLRLFSISHSPLGKTPLEVLRDAALENLLRETILRQEVRSGELRIEAGTLNGEPRHFQVNALPLALKDGTFSGAVVVFHEITRIKQLEEVRKEFVSNVSHELRTPLSIFQGYLETLLDQEELPADERQRIYRTLKRHSDRLNALVNDLLALARLESRRMTIEPELIDLTRYFHQLREDWSQRLSQKQLSLELKLPTENIRIEADPLRMEQVFNNLLDNAVKYSRDSGHIWIEAVVEEDRVAVEIRDEGSGIPPRDLPHIFERFYRVDKARSRDLGGTGLGLSIVKHIVQIHEGGVTALSEHGRGTTIRLWLPLKSSSLNF